MNKERIELGDLPAEILGDGSEVYTGTNRVSARNVIPLGSMTLEELEREAICQALEKASHNQVKAARLLGISRDTLRYRMKKFSLLESGTGN